ncbi:hypothetical protein BGX28_006808 [Mortierella sp. GBA30]|nr:hypothetical protein BGX28_006808 [Mortierella sp. GBA30]
MTLSHPEHDERTNEQTASVKRPLPNGLVPKTRSLVKRFQIFDNMEEWPKIKAYKGGNRLEEIDYSTDLRSTRKALALGEIETNRPTHAGRHGATRELEDMELHIDNIARIGRWAHGKMCTYYFSKLDILLMRY